jgi:hypothetical protein
MREPPFDPTERDRARLRVVVADIERHLSCLGSEASPTAHRTAMRALITSWAALVELLALGHAPEIRLCPACGYTGMRAGIRCGGCWAPLPRPGLSS